MLQDILQGTHPAIPCVNAAPDIFSVGSVNISHSRRISGTHLVLIDRNKRKYASGHEIQYGHFVLTMLEDLASAILRQRYRSQHEPA